VANENPALLRCEAQHQFVIQIIQSGSLGGLKIDAGLAAQRCIDNNPLEIIVGLEPYAHCGLARYSRAFCNRA